MARAVERGSGGRQVHKKLVAPTYVDGRLEWFATGEAPVVVREDGPTKIKIVLGQVRVVRRNEDFITKSPPAAALLKQAAGIAKGSGVPNVDKVATVTIDIGREFCI